MRGRTFRLIAIALFTIVASATQAQVKITVDHNTEAQATSAFNFKHVPAPAQDDAGSQAKLTLIDGQLESNGADLSALTDGLLPNDEDEPGANVFFNAGSWGGRIRMDFGSAIEIAQINSYSWHPNARGPQLYKVYGSDATDAAFNPAPKRGVDPATCGWKLIATVSTVPPQGQQGGQYGASITNPGGSLGKYRYLLFDCYPTEANDNWGNTFYSEIDVVAKK